jgi:hypothetical protein
MYIQNIKSSPNVGNLCKFTMYKQNSCLFRIQTLATMRFDLDRFDCMYITL